VAVVRIPEAVRTLVVEPIPEVVTTTVEPMTMAMAIKSK
jgi:hypothetical protein